MHFEERKAFETMKSKPTAKNEGADGNRTGVTALQS